MTEMMLRFVPAEPKDFEALLALRIEAMRESLDRIGRFDPARSRKRILDSYSAKDTRHIFVDDAHAGFVATRMAEDALLLEHLYVRPGMQRRGIGSAVLAVVIDEATKLKLPLRVGALKLSEANAFYLRHGFAKINEDEWDIYYLRPYAQDDGTAMSS